MVEVGDALPDIALTGADGGPVRLGGFAGRPLVLFFYPKDDTPGCTNEAKDFSALLPDFTAVGAAVLGVSKDSPASHAKFTARHALAVPLASDTGALSDALGIWAEKVNYGRSYMGMVRTTLLVGADGTVARVWPKVRVAGHAAAVLEAVRGA